MLHSRKRPILREPLSAVVDAEETVVAALQRAEARQEAQVPFADEGSSISGFFKQRRQRRMAGRQADTFGTLRIQRLFQTQREAILITAGNEGGACRRAGRG